MHLQVSPGGQNKINPEKLFIRQSRLMAQNQFNEKHCLKGQDGKKDEDFLMSTSGLQVCMHTPHMRWE